MLKSLRRSYMWADGQPLAQIEAVTTPPPDLIVDNPQATFTGAWATSTSITGFYGANYRTNTKGTGTHKAVWTVNVLTTGTYQVYARWVAASSNASNAPFTVKHSTGSQTIAVNQRTNNGQWMLLGSYTFTAGTAGSVTLTDKANGTVIADAIKLVATTGGTTSEVVRYLHGDHLNTPRLGTDAQGQVVWRWEGEACGATAPTGSVTVNLRFPGQYYDSETGLHYNHHRYYDPKLCRYLTSDPKSVLEHAEDFIDSIKAGSPQPVDFNPFVYAGNNPLRFTDPTGLDYWMEGAVPSEQGIGLHQSVCVGKWDGVRKCISFGRKPGEGNCWFDCKGHVYYDRSAAGPIVDERYRYTDAATDRRISAYFDSLAGNQGMWDLLGGKNCRVFSEQVFQYLVGAYGGRAGPPPQPKPKK